METKTHFVSNPDGSFSEVENKYYFTELDIIGKTVPQKICSCFNCDKCAEQMRAYYKRTGELEPKTERKTCSYCNYQYGGIDDGSHEVVCPTFLKTKTEEKKPSERIEELVFTLETRDEKERLLVARIMAIFGKVLDEQFEKGK